MNFLLDFGIDANAALKALDNVQDKLNGLLQNKPLELKFDTRLATQNADVLATAFNKQKQALQETVATNKAAMAQLVVDGQKGSEQYNKLAADIKAAEAQIKKMGDAAKEVDKDFDGSAGGGGIGKFKESLGSIGDVLSGGLLVGGFAAIGGGILSLGKKMIDANKETETYATQLTSLMGNATLAKERIQELAKFGAETPFELSELVRAEKVLIGFGLQGEKALKLTGQSATQLRSTIGDVAAATGQKFEDIALIFGKFSSGAVGESITRLQELGIATKEQMKELGVQFGKSGELLSPLPVAMQAVTKIANQKFAGGMKDLSSTAAGQLSTLADNIEQGFIKVGEPLFTVFKNAVTALNNFLSSDVFQGILSFFTNAIGGVISTFVTLGTAVVDLVQKAFQPLASAFGELGKALAPTSGEFGKLMEALKPLGSLLIEGLKLPFEFVATAISTTLSFVISITKAIVGFVSALFPAKTEAGATGAAVSGIATGAQKAASAFDTLKGVIGGVTSAFRSIKEIVGEAFAALSAFNFAKLGEILSGAGAKISGDFTKGFNEVTKQSQAATTDLAAATRQINSDIEKLALEADSLSDTALKTSKETLTKKISDFKAAGQISDKETANFLSRVKGIKKTFLDITAEIKELRLDAPKLTDGQVSTRKSTLVAEADKQLQAAKITQAQYKKYIEEIEALGKKEKDAKDKQFSFSDELAKLKAQEEKLRGDIQEKNIQDETERAILNIENKKKEEETKLAIEVAALAKRKELNAQQKSLLEEQLRKNAQLRKEILSLEENTILDKGATKRVDDDFKEAQEAAKAEIELNKRTADAIIAQDEASVKRRNDLRKAALERQQKIDFEAQLRTNEDYKKALAELQKLELKKKFGISVDDAEFDAAKKKIEDLKTSLSGAGGGLFGFLASQAQALAAFVTKANFEAEEARIKGIQDSIEREYKLKILNLERLKSQEVESAGESAELRLNAERKFLAEKSKLDADYLRKTDVFFATSERLSQAFQGFTFRPQNDAKEADERRKKLKEEENSLLDSLRNREISLEKYNEKVRKLQEQQAKDSKKQNDKLQQVFDVFNKTVSASLDQFAGAYLQKFADLAAEGKVAFDVLGAAAAASFGSMIAQGVEAKKALLLTLIDLVSKAILAFTPQIAAASIALLGPIAGPIAAGVAVAAVQAALAFARGQVLAAKGVIDLQGAGTETSDSIPARLSKGESVMRADITRREKGLLAHLHAGGTSDEFFVNQRGELVERLVQKAIEQRFTSMTNAVYSATTERLTEKLNERLNERLSERLSEKFRERFTDTRTHSLSVVREFARDAVQRETRAAAYAQSFSARPILEELQSLRAETMMFREQTSTGLKKVERAAHSGLERRTKHEFAGSSNIKGRDLEIVFTSARERKMR